MILDSQETFSSAQSLAVGTGDTASTNVLDTLTAQDEGLGSDVKVAVLVTTALTSAGGATIQAVLQGSPDNATWSDIESGPALAYNAAGAAAGQYLLLTRIPPYSQTYRYLRVAYRVGTAALTAGAATAFIAKDLQLNKTYGIGYTVL